MDDERVVSGDRGRQLADHLGECTRWTVGGGRTTPGGGDPWGGTPRATCEGPVDVSCYGRLRWVLACWPVTALPLFSHRTKPLQVSSSSRPAPKITSTWSRPSSVWSTSSVKRCQRAWTPETPPSQGPNRGPSWQSSRRLLTRTVHVKADSPFLVLLSL